MPKGRPKGSKNKPKIEPFKPGKLQEEFDAAFGSNNPKETTQFDKEFNERGFATTPNKGIFCVDADKFQEMPENWFSMPKTEKLKWLTEHRR